MAKYQITAPDGNTYEITAPDTATQEEVLAYAKANYQPTPSPSPIQATAEAPRIPAVESFTERMAQAPINLFGGAGELGLMALTGLISQVPKAFGGLGGIARGITTGDIQESAKTVEALNQLASQMTYQPKYTEFGKQTAESLGKVFALPGRAGKFAGEETQKFLQPITGVEPAAYVGATLESLGEAAPMLASIPLAKKAMPSGKPIATQITKQVSQGIEKGIRPSIPEVGTTAKAKINYNKRAETAVTEIIKNKNILEFADEAGEMVKGQLPKNLNQFSQAIDQVKGNIFKQFDDLAQTATGKGAVVDMQSIVQQLTPIVNSKSLKATAPDVVSYAETMINNLSSAKSMTASEAQEAIAALNNKLKSVKDYNSVQKSYVDAIIANNMRKSLDDAIEKTGGAGYQELKNKYGALKAIEKDVNRRAIVEARKNPKGLLDFTDIFTAGQAIKGIGSISPETIAASSVMKILKEKIKRENDPNRIISNMFSKTEELMGKQISEPVKGIPGSPIPGDIARSIKNKLTQQKGIFIDNNNLRINPTREAQQIRNLAEWLKERNPSRPISELLSSETDILIDKNLPIPRTAREAHQIKQWAEWLKEKNPPRSISELLSGKAIQQDIKKTKPTKNRVKEALKKPEKVFP